jgi:hypothetical protein
MLAVAGFDETLATIGENAQIRPFAPRGFD